MTQTTATIATQHSLTVRDALMALATEAACHGDEEQVRLCAQARRHPLRDSDTAQPVEIDDVGGSVAYTELVAESLGCSQPEGHVMASTGRRVYAE